MKLSAALRGRLRRPLLPQGSPSSPRCSQPDWAPVGAGGGGELYQPQTTLLTSRPSSRRRKGRGESFTHPGPRTPNPQLSSAPNPPGAPDPPSFHRPPPPGAPDLERPPPQGAPDPPQLSPAPPPQEPPTLNGHLPQKPPTPPSFHLPPHRTCDCNEPRLGPGPPPRARPHRRAGVGVGPRG